MEKLLHLFENSSLPGLPIVINSKRWITKIVWLLSIGSLLVVSIWFISILTQNYYKNQEINYSETIQEYRSEFPAVSLCTPIEKINIQSIMENLFRNDQENLANFISFNLSETLIYCTFEGLPCKWNDFSLDSTGLFLKAPFACYRFNSGLNAAFQPVAIRKISSNDIDRGLVINLNLSKFKQQLNFNSKFKIYIENASTIFIAPGKSDNSDSITIPAGENIIKVARELIKRSKTLNENCYNQKESSNYRLVKLFNSAEKSYLQSDCLDLCVFEKLCGFSYTEGNQSLDFLLGRKYECIAKSNEEGILNSNLSIQEQCNQECPLECESFRYKMSHSYLGHYFSQSSFGAESILKLSVYYPKLEYTLSGKLIKITLEDLISQLGGVLGLFLGVSFFTFVEILIIFLEVLDNFWKRKVFTSKTNSKLIDTIIQQENLALENLNTIQNLKNKTTKEKPTQVNEDENTIIKNDEIIEVIKFLFPIIL